MEKTIKKGKTTQIVFKNGYESTEHCVNDEELLISQNDIRDDFCVEKDAIKLFKETPIYIRIRSKNEDVALDIHLSVEDAEEMHRYIGEILEEIKTL